MAWPIGIAAYVVIWWLVIFTILPVGVRPTEEGDIGHAAGAPANPRLKIKAAITTAIAAVLWLLLYWAVHSNLIDLRAP